MQARHAPPTPSVAHPAYIGIATGPHTAFSRALKDESGARGEGEAEGAQDMRPTDFCFQGAMGAIRIDIDELASFLSSAKVGMIGGASKRGSFDCRR